MADGPLLPPLPGVALALTWVAALGLTRLSAWRRAMPNATLHVAAIGLLGLLCAGFYWRVLFTREASVPAGGGDFNSFYYPLARFAADQIQSGRLPLWNPTLFAGAPLAADFQVGLLYPPNLIAFLVARPFEYGALEALAILHFWLASVCAYLLWRVVGGGLTGGLVAGVTYAYGGFMVAHLGHPPMLGVAAWLPLLLACLFLLLRRGSVRWVAVSALVLALMILAGHPQMLLFSLVAAGVWCGGVAWIECRRAGPASAAEGSAPPRRPLTRAWRSWLAAGTGLAGALGLGLALAAPLLLPALQLGRRSVRSALSYGETTAFSLRPMHLAQLLVPKAFGDSPTSYLDALGFSGEVWFYSGVITILLAILGIILRPRWPIVIGLMLAALALVLALGPVTPLHGWLYRFAPGFGQVRAPGRWSLLYSLGLALAAAGGAGILVGLARAHLATTTPALRRAAGWLAGFAGLLALVLLALTGFLLNPRDPSAPLMNFLNGLGWLLLLLLLALAVLALLARRAVPGVVAGGLIASLVVLDLFSAHAAFNPTTADLTSGFQHAEIVAALRESGMPPAAIRLDSDTGAPTLWQPAAAAVLGLRDVAGAYNPLGLADYANFYDAARRDRAAPLYDLLAVSHIVARPDKLPPAGQLTPVMTTQDGLVLHERAGSMPRAAVVHGARRLSDPEAVLAALRDPSFDPRREALLLGSGETAAPGMSAAPMRPATIVHEEPDRLEIQATADAPGYLVIADTYYPGWRAEVNGQPVALERANYTFRAVPLPPGQHTVRLIFDPPLWRLGWLISLPALALVLALLVIPSAMLWRLTPARLGAPAAP